MSRTLHPGQKPFPVPTPLSSNPGDLRHNGWDLPSIILSLPVMRPTKHTNPLIFPTQVPKLLGTGATRSPAGPGWPGVPSLTLSRQLTFSVGYTTFPQRAHWGFIVAVPAGGGCCCGGDWGLRGAAVTSPGEPRATSGQAEGLRALANCPGGVQGGAAGPGAGRARRRWH